MKRFSVLLAITTLSMLAGCSDGGYGEKKATSATGKGAAAFLGKPADKPLDYDLSGTWTVFRYETAERPSKLARWEALWTLHKTKAGCWTEQNGQGWFHLLGDTPPQTLRWERADGKCLHFSINEQRFGLLLMTGSDDELYQAVRTEGGKSCR